jgi:hypothetical protein
MPGFHAVWFGQSGYMTLCPGDIRTATVAYYNSGSAGWVAARFGETAFLGTSGPEPGQDRASQLGGDGSAGSPNTGWPRYNRLAMQPSSYVGPGQVAWFQFAVQAPMTPGKYRIALRPLIEGTQWMEDYGVFWVVTVPSAAAGVQPPSEIITIAVSSSTHGFVSAVTKPGATCSARAVLPSGSVSNAAGLQVSAIANASGIVSWSYGTVSNTLPGTGTHTIFCSYLGMTAQTSVLFTVLAAPAPTSTPGGGLTVADIDGKATLLASDGTYLGKVSSNQFESESICNEFGTYGSEFASKSVRNEFGTYGSPFASQSAYNEFTSTPPRIIYQGGVVGYLTKNEFLRGALDPDLLFALYDCIY